MLLQMECIWIDTIWFWARRGYDDVVIHNEEPQQRPKARSHRPQGGDFQELPDRRCRARQGGHIVFTRRLATKPLKAVQTNPICKGMT